MQNRRRVRLHAAAVVVVAAVLGASPHAACAGRDAPYALGPEARAPILAALRRMQPALVLAEGGIDHDHVLVRLCPRPEATDGCFRLRLEHPGSDCSGARWGQFCARFPDGEPPPTMVSIIADALRATEHETLWTDLARPARTAPSAAGARTLAIALALVLGPLATAYLIGSAWRRRAGDREGAAFTLGAMAVPTASAVGLDASLLLIGFWDAACVGLLAGAGWLLAAHRRRPDWKTLAVCVASSVGALLVAEAACRALLRSPPAFPMDREPTLLIATAARRMSWFSMACASIYGNQPPAAAFAPVYPGSWQPRSDVERRILHLGDSMVQGSPTDGRFTDDLARLEPDVEHVNAAIGGTGPDVYLSILRRFTSRGDFAFEAVVIHLTPNDYEDVDRPSYPCSEWKPLLVYGPSGTRLRFADARPDGREARRAVWRQSPPPYVLRAAMRVSSLAAHLAAAVVDLQHRVAAASAGRSAADRHAHFTAIMRDVVDELREHDVPLVVNLFHDRTAVERGRRPSNGPEHTMQEIAEALGVVVLDTWEPLVAAVGRDAAPFTNQAGPTDSHLNADGHALVADWLHRELPAAIARARMPRADRRPAMRARQRTSFGVGAGWVRKSFYGRRVATPRFTRGVSRPGDRRSPPRRAHQLAPTLRRAGIYTETLRCAPPP